MSPQPPHLDARTKATPPPAPHRPIRARVITPDRPGSARTTSARPHRTHRNPSGKDPTENRRMAGGPDGKDSPFARFKIRPPLSSPGLSACLASFRPLPSLPVSSSSRPAPPSYGPHGRGRFRPRRPPQRGDRIASGGFPTSFAGAGAAVLPHAAPQLLLPHSQLGHPPPPPLLQEPPLIASYRGSGCPVPGYGEGPPLHGWRRRRFAPALPSAAVEPPHPALRHRCAASGEAGRRGRGGGGACAPSVDGDEEAGVLHRAVQGGDRPGLRGDPRDSPPAPAQEAPAHGTAAARLALPGIMPGGCHARLVQDRGEVIGDTVEIQMARDFGMC